MVLVDKTAQNVAASDLRGRHHPVPGLQSRVWRLKLEAPMGPGPVVVLGVCTKDPLQVTLTEDADVIEALPSRCLPSVRAGGDHRRSGRFLVRPGRSPSAAIPRIPPHHGRGSLLGGSCLCRGSCARCMVPHGPHPVVGSRRFRCPRLRHRQHAWRSVLQCLPAALYVRPSLVKTGDLRG
jgi:hypothetical protein